MCFKAYPFSKKILYFSKFPSGEIEVIRENNQPITLITLITPITLIKLNHISLISPKFKNKSEKYVII